jgi:hypothetical protein
MTLDWKYWICGGTLCLRALGAHAALDCPMPELIASSTSPEVFGGRLVRIQVQLRNPHDDALEIHGRIRRFQLASATAIPCGDSPWKAIRILPHQTILEPVTLEFPRVNAETRFLVHWLDGTNPPFGSTVVLVHPTNLLDQLKPWTTTGNGLGIWDSHEKLKPLLNERNLPFTDLEGTGTESFRGTLAIFLDHDADTRPSPWRAPAIKGMALKGVGVVWIRPPIERSRPAQPSYRAIKLHTGSVVVAHPELVTDLAQRPESQLNLIALCRLAMTPEPNLWLDQVVRP